MSNVSVMSTSSVATNATAATTMTGKGGFGGMVGDKPAGSSVGRWNSMKMILGLRVGNGGASKS
jgi:hypothetical protein